MKEKNFSVIIIDILEKILLVLILGMVISNGNKLSLFATKLRIAILFLSIILLVLKREKRIKYIFIGWVFFAFLNAISLIYTIDLKEGLVLFQIIIYAIPLVQYGFSEKNVRTFFTILEYLLLFGAVTIIISKNWHDFPIIYFKNILLESNIVGIISETRGNAFSGIFANNGNAAFLLAVGIEIAGCKYIANKERNKREFLYIIIYTVALILTNKRALLLIPFIVLFIVIRANNVKVLNIKNIIITFISIIIILMFYNNIENVAVFKRFVTDDDNRRGDFRFFCVEMFKKEPITGYGLGAFNKYITDEGYRVYSETNPSGIWIYHAHNVYLQVLAESGILGFIIFIILVCTPILDYLKIIKEEEIQNDYNKKMYINIMIALQLIFIMYCLTGNPLYMKEQIVLYLFSVSTFTTLCKKIKEKE